MRRTLQPIFYRGLVFRAFQDDDADAFANAVRESVDTVGRWMPWCTTSFSANFALQWFEQCRVDLAAEQAHEFGVFSQASGEFVGGAGLNAINHEHLFCNLGYWVRQSAQRQGVALCTLQALVPYAFMSLGMQRVEIVIANGNTSSEALARKFGAHFEGVARNRLRLRGNPVSASVFSVVP